MRLKEIDRMLLRIAEALSENRALDYLWIGMAFGIEYRIRVTGYPKPEDRLR